MHKDSRNAPYPNLLLALTRFRGGAVWCESSAGTVLRTVRGLDRPGLLLPVADAPQTLMAHEVFHQTEPWEGDRLLLVGFTVQRTADLSPAQLQLLQSLGFVMPSSYLKQGGHDDDDKLGDLECMVAKHDFPPVPSTPGEAAASRAPDHLNTPAGGSIRQAPANTPVEGPTPQAVKEDQAVDVLSSGSSCDEAGDFDASTSRCRGPAIRCRHTKDWRELVDGFGLCSPGRWRPLARDATATSAEWEHSEVLPAITAIYRSNGKKHLEFIQFASSQDSQYLCNTTFEKKLENSTVPDSWLCSSGLEFLSKYADEGHSHIPNRTCFAPQRASNIINFKKNNLWAEAKTFGRTASSLCSRMKVSCRMLQARSLLSCLYTM